jgi:hypothetical protein
MFAVAMLALLATSHVLQGLVALLDDDYFLVQQSGLMLSVNYAAWGWTQLVLGLLVWGAGMGLLAGRGWARGVSVALAVVSALVSLMFLAAFPTWSALMILLDILVIWVITLGGSATTRE